MRASYTLCEVLTIVFMFKPHWHLTDITSWTKYPIMHKVLVSVRCSLISLTCYMRYQVLVSVRCSLISLTCYMRYKVLVSVRCPLIPRSLQLLPADVTSCHLMSVRDAHWYDTLHEVYEGLMCLRQPHWYRLIWYERLLTDNSWMGHRGTRGKREHLFSLIWHAEYTH